MGELRVCRICQQRKSIDSFEVDSRIEGRYTNRCKVCKGKSNDRAVMAFNKLRHRAAINGTQVDVTLTEIKALFAAFDGKCVYCNAQETPDGPTFHLEHVVARSAGGRDHISNLVISCPACNHKKHTKPVVTHYFDDDRFQDKNFNLLVSYISITSGQPVREITQEMAEAHADHQIAEIQKEC